MACRSQQYLSEGCAGSEGLYIGLSGHCVARTDLEARTLPSLKKRVRGSKAALTLMVLVPLAIAAGTVSPTLTASAALTNTRLAIPECTPAQIDEWMAGPSGRYDASRNYSADVIYANLGKTCTLARTYAGVQAVSGKDHAPVGMGSTVPLAAFGGSFILRSQHTAAASVIIYSISSASIRQTCAPKYADAIEVFGLYKGWPVKYFNLGIRLLVCTTSDDNVGAGPIALTKRIVVHV